MEELFKTLYEHWSIIRELDFYAHKQDFLSAMTCIQGMLSALLEKDIISEKEWKIWYEKSSEEFSEKSNALKNKRDELLTQKDENEEKLLKITSELKKRNLEMDELFDFFLKQEK